MERRRSQRKAASVRTMMKSRWLIADAVCLDASMGGFLIEARDDFSVGDGVEVAVELKGGARLNCEGEIVREAHNHPLVKQGRGFGIRIVKIAPDVKAMLEAWLKDLPEASAVAAAAAAKRPVRKQGKAAVGAAPDGAGGKIKRVLLRLLPGGDKR